MSTEDGQQATQTQVGRTWSAFWFFAAVFVLCSTFLTTLGLDTGLWNFKTPEEKVLQQVLIDNQRAKATARHVEGPNTLRSTPAGCPGIPK